MLLVHQNTGKENRYGNKFFAVLVSTLGDFIEQIKKSVIYTLRDIGNIPFIFQKIVRTNLGTILAPFSPARKGLSHGILSYFDYRQKKHQRGTRMVKDGED